ncbi:MAG TPA: branched-chain amino acid ABC transporter permease [Candidatus Dormibacteraeota bacterium]|nr:branched-chain amino acid ABC transporter permease [Candidatus Dormibacteraeota bacterium]
MPDIRPYLVLGLALGGVFALSGVGLVVLYRATGVLNLAYGAVGALGALIAWSLINSLLIPEWIAYLVAVAFGGVSTLLYGMLFGPPLAQRDPLVKAVGTLGFALILLGTMSWAWSYQAHSLILPTTQVGFQLGEVRVNATQLMGLGLGVVVTAVTAAFLRFTRLGVAMRSLANHRETTAMLGVPVRRVEAAAWLGSGLLSGATGLLLSTLVGLDIVGLTFLVIAALSAALIGRLQSLWATMAAGLGIGVVQALLTPVEAISPYRTMTPFLFAIVALLWFGAAGRGLRQA